MKRRNYRQYCATARSLDVVGERWTLLLVRELLTGPKRNKDLLENLPGIGTNLLAARLRHLEDSELLTRYKLAPPSGATVYDLTPLGAELEPIVMALARWGQNLLGTPGDDDIVRASWSLLSMKALLRPERAVGFNETCEFRIEDEIFHASVAGGDVQAAQGPAHQPDLVVRTDTDTFLAVLSATLSPGRAVAEGRAELMVGDVSLLERYLYIFGIEPIEE